MKKYTKIVSLFLSFFFLIGMMTFLASCDSNKEFKIMFTDYDGSVLYSEQVKKGKMPSYPLDDPTRKSDDDYTYTFDGWWPSLEKAKEDKIYTAYYTRTLKEEYTITFKNYNGSILDTVKVKEGEKPTYLGDTPTKEHDEHNKFLFTGWDKDLVEVTGDATYTASYKAFDLEKFIVAFQYEDETVIDAYEANEGDMAVYTGETPTKEQTEDAKYRFRSWSPALGEVTGDVIYTAKFMAVPYNYFITINSDGGESAANGKIESFKTDKISADQFVYDVVKDNYRFDGWAYNDTLIFDKDGNTLVDLDEIEFEYNVSITAHYAEEAIIGITYVAYNGVNGFELDRYDELPAKYGSGSVTGFHNWNASAAINSQLVSNDYYEFDGWYENDNLISIKPSFNYYLFDKDVELECRFTIKEFTLKMYVNNDELGEIMVKNHTNWESDLTTDFYYGEKIVVAAKSISDIEFLGWYNYYDELITDDEYCIIEVGTTMSLKAKWDYFKINYSIPAGVKNDDNPKYYTSKSENITLVNPSSEFFGMAFKCWINERNFSPITIIDTSKLEDINIYSSYQNDPEYNFDLTKPKEIINAILPAKVTEIPAEAFSLCENLKTISLPANLKTIGLDAFKNCASLEKVYYDGTLDNWLNMSLMRSRETNPMYYASEFYILNSTGDVTYNGKKYSLLTEVTLDDPTGLTLYAFTGFECIKTVNVTSSFGIGFGIDAFYGCDIDNFYYDGTLEKWCTLRFGNGDIYSNPMMAAKNAYFYDSNGTLTHNGKKYSKLTSITLPTDLETINDCAFAGCTSLQTVIVTYGSSLKNIGNYAFYGCTSLKSIKIEVMLNTIGKEAFAECSSLETIDFSPYLSSIWGIITKGEDWHRNVPATHVKFTDSYIPIE